MAISDFIKPRWKHSDPEVRLKAVSEMGADQADRLREIARSDTHIRVKLAAIRKISDEAFLESLSEGPYEEAVRKAARDRTQQIYRSRIRDAETPEQRTQWLARLTDEEILTEIAIGAEDPEFRMTAARRVHDPEKLCRITESHCGLKIGSAIVERLDDPEALSRIADRASNQKVKKLARARRSLLLGGPGEGRKGIDDRLAEVVRRLEEITSVPQPRLAMKRLEEADAEWRELDPEYHHPLVGAFESVSERLRSRVMEMERKTAVANEARAIVSDAETRAKDTAPPTPGDVDGFLVRWEKGDLSILDSSERESLESRFASAKDVLIRRLETEKEKEEARRKRIERRRDLVRQAEIWAASDDWNKADAQWAVLDRQWGAETPDDPASTALKAEYDRLAESYRGRKHACEQEAAALRNVEEARLRSILSRVEDAVTAAERGGLEVVVKAAQEDWRQAGSVIPDLKANLSGRFREACDAFLIRQREFRERQDWERWANLNQKEELCVVIERLNEASTVQTAGQVVQEARKKWREIGPVAKEKSEEIWNRFNRACDRVYERCLARKQSLYEALVRALEGREKPEVFRWTDAAETVKSLQEEWNAIGALPLAVEKDLREKFHSEADGFFRKLREFYQERDALRKDSLSRKTALCELAESLVDAENRAETARKLRALQQEWKETGPLSKAEGDALWARFRAACDGFFDRLKKEEPENLKQKEALCAEAESLVGSAADGAMEEVRRKLMDLQNRWKTIGPVPAEQADEVWCRFRKTCDAFFEQFHLWLKDRRADRETRRQLKEALVLRAESVAGSSDWKEAGEQLKAIQREWKDTGPADRESDQALWLRLRTACDAFFTRRNRCFEDKDRDRRENMRRREELCIALESLARLVLPAEAMDRIPTVRPAEQLSVGLDMKDEIVVPDNPKATRERALRKVRDLQKVWRSIGPGIAAGEEAVMRRFRNAVDLFFPGRPDNAGSQNPADREAS